MRGRRNVAHKVTGRGVTMPARPSLRQEARRGEAPTGTKKPGEDSGKARASRDGTMIAALSEALFRSREFDLRPQRSAGAAHRRRAAVAAWKYKRRGVERAAVHDRDQENHDRDQKKRRAPRSPAGSLAALRGGEAQTHRLPEGRQTDNRSKASIQGGRNFSLLSCFQLY